MKKRVLVICVLLAVGAVGLVTPQLVSAGAPNCGGKVVQTVTFPEAPALLAPAAATGCGAVPVINEPDAVFLCYSKFQTEPGVWSPEQAKELLRQGYYYPVAVKGNVPGGTNLGGYHLVCNAPAATPPGLLVNENGLVVPAELAGDTLGYYPLGA